MAVTPTKTSARALLSQIFPFSKCWIDTSSTRQFSHIRWSGTSWLEESAYAKTVCLERMGVERGKASKNRYLIYFVTITAETQQIFYKEPQWVYVEVSRVRNRRCAELMFTSAVCFKHIPGNEHVVGFPEKDPSGILRSESCSSRSL